MDADGPLDAGAAKRLVVQLERAMTRNTELRVKHADAPERFLESEVALHDSARRFQVLATAPELYPLLIKLGAVESLVWLLAHDNPDVAAAAVDVVAEFVDADSAGDLEATILLMDALIAHSLLDVLVRNLGRFEESAVPAHAQAVAASLQIVENLAEAKPDVCSALVKAGLLDYLLKRLACKVFDGTTNMLSVVETLAILLQDHDDNQREFAARDGIDAILRCLAPYRKRDPAPGDETEFMENLFDIVCLALLVPASRDLFHKAEGVQLMIMLVQTKALARRGALKTLALALTDHPPACATLVDAGGLGPVFGAFLKGTRPIAAATGKKRKQLSPAEVKQDEEHVSLILASLLLHIDPTTEQGVRLLHKFREKDYEKTLHLMSQIATYHERVHAADAGAEAGRKRRRVDNDGDNDQDPEADDERYLDRLDAGLCTLQNLCLALGQVAGHDDIIARAAGRFAPAGSGGFSLDVFAAVLREYADNLAVEAAATRQRIADLADKIAPRVDANQDKS